MLNLVTQTFDCTSNPEEYATVISPVEEANPYTHLICFKRTGYVGTQSFRITEDMLVFHSLEMAKRMLMGTVTSFYVTKLDS